MMMIIITRVASEEDDDDDDDGDGDNNNDEDVHDDGDDDDVAGHDRSAMSQSRDRGSLASAVVLQDAKMVCEPVDGEEPKPANKSVDVILFRTQTYTDLSKQLERAKDKFTSTTKDCWVCLSRSDLSEQDAEHRAVLQHRFNVALRVLGKDKVEPLKARGSSCDSRVWMT